MGARKGRFENGVVVLSDASNVPEGAVVTVLIDTPESVSVSPEELERIDAGLAEMAASPERLDARSFLRELRSKR